MNQPSHDSADVATGLMLQITQYAERLALLDQRETGHCRELTHRLDDLSQQLTEVIQQADAVHDLACKQAALLETSTASISSSPRSPPGSPRRQHARTMTRAVTPTRWHQRLDGGISTEPNATSPSTDCAPGSIRSTGLATATSPPPSAHAGTSTPCACMALTG